MTGVLIVIALALVSAGGAAVVLTGDPDRQAITLSVYGLLLGVLFLLLQAPDVALSQLAVGTAVVPLLVMLTLRKVRGR
jgi:energy-converting hydrogenase B subunit D